MSRRHAIVVAGLLCLTRIVFAQALFPYSMPWDDTSANLTNLSNWNDKPAGRDGFVTVRDGHLYANGKRLRLLGGNVVFGSAFPSHEDANRIAARMARFGLNIVRFHHMDSRPAPDGLLQRDMLTLDPAQLDKLDYFIAALKREGIYADLNLHVGRLYPGYVQWRDTANELAPKYWKGVDNFFPPMIVMQRDYARDLLTHRNPYTGNRYVDEPAVALIEINNENGLIREWRAGSLDAMTDPVRTDFQQRWTDWLHERYPDSAALAQAWGARDVPLGPEMFGARFNVHGGEAGWNLQVVDKAEAALTEEDAGSARLSIYRAGLERWHVQLHQNGLRFKAGEPYTIKLRLRADRPLRVRLMAMQAHAPWQYLWQTTVSVGTEWQDYVFAFAPTADEDNARFTLGDLGAEAGRLWLAEASLKPGGKLGLKAGESLEQGTVAIATRSDFLSRTVQAQRDWLQFLWDTEAEYWNGMQRYLKTSLGAKSLIVGTQVSYSPGPIQAQLDVVDGHAYWQHPRFPGKPWDPNNWRIANSPMAGVENAGTLADLALRRMPGKPFIVTEYNHPAPSEYASEALPLAAAYAALQDWDGLFIYSYGSHNKDWNPGYMINYFDTHADPNKMTSLIAAAALFRREDVATPGSPAQALPAHDKIIDALRASGSMPSADMFGAPRGEAVRGPASLASLAGEALPLPIRSVTDQLTWGVDKGRTVSIDAPRSKGLIGAKLGEAFDADGVRLELLRARHDNGVIVATLMAGRDFASSGRVLVTALGAEENTGQEWTDATHTSLGRKWGGAPVQVEGIAARISLPVAASRVSAWALDERGNRRDVLKVEGDDRATIETDERFRSLWYEIEIH